MRVVVVGGGIVGLASAYYLADRGADVVVLEKSTFGAGSTERSAGGIRLQFSTRVNVELSKASIEVWESFEERFDVDWRRPGYLWLARDPETADAFRADVAMQNDLDVPTELLDPVEATEHCPELDPEPFVAATYAPTDGFADPHLAVEGFRRQATAAGADLRAHTPVTEVRRAGEAVVGVVADGEHVDADVVVNAAGPWGREVAAMAGIDLPVFPRRRQVAVVDPDPPVPESVPLTVDLDRGSYFRPERDGAALVGGHFAGTDPDRDPDDYRTDVDLAWTATAVERAAEYAGYFGPATRIRRGWAGLYAVTPDDHPIVEETVPGFVNAVGFSGHGFMHSPATGQVVAELALDGAASLVDVSRLSGDRFDRGVDAERNVV
ncbi:MAG: FAD-dependent oxidoreductase [Halobacteriales archaeon]